MPTLCSWVSLLCNDISSKGLGIRDCVDIQAFTCLTNTADVSLSHGHDAVVVSRSLSVLLCLQCSMCMTYNIDAVPATLLNTASHCSHSRLLPHHGETLHISDVYSLQPRLHTSCCQDRLSPVTVRVCNSWWVAAGQIPGARQGAGVLMPLPCSARMLQARRFRSVCLAHLLVRHSKVLLMRTCINHFLSAAYHHSASQLHLHSSKSSMGTQHGCLSVPKLLHAYAGQLFCCLPKVFGPTFCPVGFAQAWSSAAVNAQILPPPKCMPSQLSV